MGLRFGISVFTLEYRKLDSSDWIAEIRQY